jgi:hypothetical protein
MNETLEKRLAALEQRILPLDSEEQLSHEESNWLLGSYAEADAELRKFPNYEELKKEANEYVMRHYEHWLSLSPEEQKKADVEDMRRIREEFLEYKKNKEHGNEQIKKEI